jgi:hypothetical protein
MLEMRVSGVSRCDCDQHDWVELADASGEWLTRLTIDTEIGAALVVAPSEPMRSDPAVDELIRAGPAGRAAQPSNLSLRCQSHDLTARLTSKAMTGHRWRRLTPAAACSPPAGYACRS